jgi:hypothetical protein
MLVGGMRDPVPNTSEKTEQQRVRYGDYSSAMAVNQVHLSYNKLTPKSKYDDEGKLIPWSPPPVSLDALDIYRLLKPYIGTRLTEQLRAVLPLAAYLVLFQLIILRTAVEGPLAVLWGVVAVIFGLLLFMEGLKQGLMPFGESIGDGLPKKASLPVVLFVTLILGVGVTFAEPAIGALRAAGSIVSVERSPYLWSLLNQWSSELVLLVGIGVGLAALLGTLRFLYGWSLKPAIYATVLPTLGLTAWFMADPSLREVIGLAWDCGAVTTGPVTVPLVLSLGIGVARTSSQGDSSLSGFGIVTMASLFPIIAVLSLAMYVRYTVDVDTIALAASQMGAASGVAAWHEQTPIAETIGGVRAIVPLVLFLYLVMRVLVREKLRNAAIIVFCIVLCVLGMLVFNIGLTYGLSNLGEQSGGLIPAAFMNIEAVAGSPLYYYALGIALAIGFAWVLGFGATLAEPALNALGITVETLTNGAFKKKLLLYAVSLGVACGIATGVCKILFNWPLAYLLLPSYLMALVMTWFSSEEFVNVAWDSAGVTTGPVTVPLVLAMGLGFGDATQALEGFGILSMASIGPIISVLGVGLWIEASKRRVQAKALKVETT